MAAGQLPATDEGRLILHSYSPNDGWYVMMTNGMYELSYATGTNHFTPYAYDRHVLSPSSAPLSSPEPITTASPR